MTTTSPTPIWRAQFFTNADSLVVPCAGGTVATFTAGTDTPVATYQDYTGTVFNEVVIQLDGAGSCNLWLDVTMSYKFIWYDANDVQQGVQDNIPGSIASQFALIGVTTTFGNVPIVLGSSTTAGPQALSVSTGLLYNPNTGVLTLPTTGGIDAGTYTVTGNTVPQVGIYLTPSNDLGFATNNVANAFVTNAGNLVAGSNGPNLTNFNSSGYVAQFSQAANIDLTFGPAKYQTGAFSIDASNDAFNSQIPLEINSALTVLNGGDVVVYPGQSANYTSDGNALQVVGSTHITGNITIDGSATVGGVAFAAAPSVLCNWGYRNASNATSGGANASGRINYQIATVSAVGLNSYSTGEVQVLTAGRYFISASVTEIEPPGVGGSVSLHIYHNSADTGCQNITSAYASGGTDVGGNFVMSISGVIDANAYDTFFIYWNNEGSGRGIYGGTGSFTGFRIS